MQQIHFSNGVSLIEMALGIFPDPVAVYLGNLLPSPLESTGVLPVAAIAAVWSSSSGMVAVIKGLDQVYEVKETRNYFHLRFIAVAYVVAFAVVLLLTAALLVFGSTIYNYLLSHSPPFSPPCSSTSNPWPGFAAALLLYTDVRVPARRRVRFLHNLAGAAFSAGGAGCRPTSSPCL